ncbi:MAG: Spy/CpxP family protein refolding chaperone [Deltaproteobacteria bacterium]|nr:Spy/CpxP family protein refolding chaperone [Deltaproteobacteria bacterium]
MRAGGKKHGKEVAGAPAGFSLALNLGCLAALAYFRVAGPPGWSRSTPPLSLRSLERTLNLNPEQARAVQALLPEHRRRLRDMRAQMSQKRQELMELMKTPNPSWPELQAKIREICRLQGELEAEMVQLWLSWSGCLNSEQKTRFLTLMEKRLISGPRGPGYRAVLGRGG